jgi:hypothetical protein
MAEREVMPGVTVTGDADAVEKIRSRLDTYYEHLRRSVALQGLVAMAAAIDWKMVVKDALAGDHTDLSTFTRLTDFADKMGKMGNAHPEWVAPIAPPDAVRYAAEIATGTMKVNAGLLHEFDFEGYCRKCLQHKSGADPVCAGRRAEPQKYSF